MKVSCDVNEQRGRVEFRQRGRMKPADYILEYHRFFENTQNLLFERPFQAYFIKTGQCNRREMVYSEPDPGATNAARNIRTRAGPQPPGSHRSSNEM